MIGWLTTLSCTCILYFPSTNAEMQSIVKQTKFKMQHKYKPVFMGTTSISGLDG